MYALVPQRITTGDLKMRSMKLWQAGFRCKQDTILSILERIEIMRYIESPEFAQWAEQAHPRSLRRTNSCCNEPVMERLHMNNLLRVL
jgi:hypothetical protein